MAAGEVGLVGARAVVVGAARVDREAERHRLQRARLVPGELEPLDVRGECLRALPDGARGGARAASPAARRAPRARRSPRWRAGAPPASPNRSHGASIRPRSAHSIAQAIVPPAEIVSRPSSSQRPLASSTASGSETPHIGPEREDVLVLDADLLAGGAPVDVLAADRARGAAVACDAAGVRQVLRGQTRGLVERRRLEVAGRERRDGVEGEQVGEGPELAVLRGGGAEGAGAQVARGGEHRRRVGGRDLRRRRAPRPP